MSPGTLREEMDLAIETGPSYHSPTDRHEIAINWLCERLGKAEARIKELESNFRRKPLPGGLDDDF